MKLEKSKNSKSLVIILGSLLIITGIGLIGYKYINDNIQNQKDDKAVEEYYDMEENDHTDEEIKPKVEKITTDVKENKINYIAILKIPKINLTRGLVDKNSKYNNVNYNIEILKESDSPDVVNGNVILAGHSGNTRISFFRHLDKLTLGDLIEIDYKNYTYQYKVTKIYDIDKTGTAEIKRDKTESTLTLITCRHNTKKQIVVIASRIN